MNRAATQNAIALLAFFATVGYCLWVTWQGRPFGIVDAILLLGVTIAMGLVGVSSNLSRIADVLEKKP